ncbi:MAG: class I SAM-dependent methyltransferase [Eubacteriales bacterium]|nr:class I SAM-dependent methyltransferase [Eubacteriales bacterium]
MENDVETVKKFYDSCPEVEWERLQNHTAEFEITRSYLDRYIKSGDTVLDMGGGPGRYSLYLASKGCDVTLVDLSQSNVDFALKKAEEKGIRITARQGDARYIDKNIAEKFDHVLLMGPLYHLLEKNDRKTAVSACLNCLRDGGILYASFISSFAGVIYYMKEGIDIMTIDPTERKYMRQVARDEDFSGLAFTMAYFARMQDIQPFFEQFGLKKLHLFGQEGIISPCEDKINAQSEQAVKEWIDISKLLCENENYMSYSEHFMYIGMKGATKNV